MSAKAPAPLTNTMGGCEDHGSRNVGQQAPNADTWRQQCVRKMFLVVVSKGSILNDPETRTSQQGCCHHSQHCSNRACGERCRESPTARRTATAAWRAGDTWNLLTVPNPAAMQIAKGANMHSQQEAAVSHMPTWTFPALRMVHMPSPKPSQHSTTSFDDQQP